MRKHSISLVSKVAGESIVFLLGTVLILAATGKLWNPYTFLSTVYSYELVGPTAGVLIAAALPFLELSIGAFLIVGVWRKEVLLISLMLFVLFCALQGYALLRGLEIECGCFSPESGVQERIGYFTLIRSILLALTNLAALVWLGYLPSRTFPCVCDARS